MTEVVAVIGKRQSGKIRYAQKLVGSKDVVVITKTQSDKWHVMASIREVEELERVYLVDPANTCLVCEDDQQRELRTKWSLVADWCKKNDIPKLIFLTDRDVPSGIRTYVNEVVWVNHDGSIQIFQRQGASISPDDDLLYEIKMLRLTLAKERQEKDKREKEMKEFFSDFMQLCQRHWLDRLVRQDSN